MRCDELSHSSQTAYWFKVRWIMRGLHRLAALTPFHDPQALAQYGAALEALCARYVAGATVLDVGCGPGDQVASFLQQYGARRCVGVDSSRGIMPSGQTAGRAFTQGTALQLPFRDKSFDVVHSRAMFHHIVPDRRIAALQEQIRVARRWVVLEDVMGLEGGVLGPCHRAYYTSIDGSYYRYTSAEWREFAARAGAAIEDVIEVSPRVLAGRYICLVLRAA